MLKREIKYMTFADEPEEVTEVFYFNISEPEMAEMDASYPEGFVGHLQKAIRETNNAELFALFKKMVINSYGEKSSDGRLFLKKDSAGNPLGVKFEQSAAYISLFGEITTSEQAAAEFMTGVLPLSAKKELEESKTPPTPPTVQGKV